MVLGTEKPICILGFLMSKSKMITRLPLKVCMAAKLIANMVLPSPLTVDVTAIRWLGLFASMNPALERIERKASLTADFGF